MCASFELSTNLDELPPKLKDNLPAGFKNRYITELLFKPKDPILILKEENKKITSSIVLWGLIPEWTKDPIDSHKPFNARGETIDIKPSFKAAWRHRRCLIPASSFFEKNYRIRKNNNDLFWLGGLWNRWLGADGSEIETCTIITTKANSLLKGLHNRMPVIIPNYFEGKWLSQADSNDLKELKDLLKDWDPEGWILEKQINKHSIANQMKLF